jgi:hypothetical protein
VCGPTATPTPCTAPNGGSAIEQLTQQTATTSTAVVTLDPGSTPGYYCLLDTYSGDSHYNAATDNSTSTECLHVTSTAPTKTTPTFSTALSSSSVPYGYSAIDTATVTGTTAGGAPTGTVTFEACGPTATPTACTAPNVGPATVQLSQRTSTSSTASVTINPGAPGWYCFLDTYSGDSRYNSATDNSTSTECLDVTASSVYATGASSGGTLATGAAMASTTAAPSTLITGSSSAVSSAVEARRDH